MLFGGDFPGQVRIANNIVAYLQNPLWHAPATASLGPNAFSQDATSQRWFRAFQAGDLRLNAGSPPWASADPDDTPPVDIDGQLREHPYNMGAY